MLLALPLVLAGCGDGPSLSDEVRGQARERVEEVRRDVERRTEGLADDLRARRDRIIARVEKVLGDLEQIVPEAPRTRPEVQRRAGEQDVETFLVGVIENVDAYWTKTLKGSGRAEPRVSYVFVAEGDRRRTGCRTVADDQAAFYCPADDTIYIAQRFAADLYEGVVEGLPGDEGGGGQAAGSFGVAYVVAHEYAHNLQTEFDVFRIGPSNSAKPFELQADCLAGSWGNSAIAQGGLTEEDIRQAIATVQSVGDFDVDNEQHHGTPDERRDAWLTGFRSGEPSSCTRFVPRA